MLIAPILAYIIVSDEMMYRQYHDLMLAMVAASYAPIGIMWWIALVHDTEQMCGMLKHALNFAALGPFLLLWVGYYWFLMQAEYYMVLKKTVNIFFGIFY